MLLFVVFILRHVSVMKHSPRTIWLLRRLNLFFSCSGFTPVPSFFPYHMCPPRPGTWLVFIFTEYRRFASHLGAVPSSLPRQWAIPTETLKIIETLKQNKKNGRSYERGTKGDHNGQGNMTINTIAARNPETAELQKGGSGQRYLLPYCLCVVKLCGQPWANAGV